MFKFLLNKILSANLTEVAETLTQTVSEAVPETAAQTAEEAGNALSLGFTTANISEALLWFITGMVGIFMVIGIIIVVVSLLNKLGSGKKKAE